MRESYNNIIYANQGINGKIFDTGDVIEAKFGGTPYQLISIFDDDKEELKLYNTKTKLVHQIQSLSSFIGGLLTAQQLDISNKFSANIANMLVSQDKRDFKTKLIQTFNFDSKVLHTSTLQTVVMKDFSLDALFRSNITASKNSSGQLQIRDGRSELFLSQLINGRHICGHYMICFDNLTYLITEYRDQNGLLSYYFNAAALQAQYLYNGRPFGYLASLTSRPDNKNSYVLFNYLGYMPSTKEFVGGFLNSKDTDVFRFLPFDSSDQMTHQELSNPGDHDIIWLTQQHPDLSKNSGDVSFA